MLAYRKISALHDDEVRSNISISSFGTALKPSIIDKNGKVDDEFELGLGSMFGDLKLQKLGSMDFRDFGFGGQTYGHLSLARTMSDFKNFQQINANIEAE
jgi:hypothetical protein